eukprot:TRINITY_DN1063_c0_g1_i1.p1 TRINITY_DN1063_c0_g1~~TRINITY_DN1063_c0_g1_i1.p1  ORF type:complete len:415 (+),score=94.79 TRINITY_DN1063_c0_g1_i1:122-1366(+)
MFASTPRCVVEISTSASEFAPGDVIEGFCFVDLKEPLHFMESVEVIFKGHEMSFHGMKKTSADQCSDQMYNIKPFWRQAVQVWPEFKLVTGPTAPSTTTTTTTTTTTSTSSITSSSNPNLLSANLPEHVLKRQTPPGTPEIPRAGGQAATLSAGKYKWPFHFEFPLFLPPTVHVNSSHLRNLGAIYYVIEAMIRPVDKAQKKYGKVKREELFCQPIEFLLYGLHPSTWSNCLQRAEKFSKSEVLEKIGITATLEKKEFYLEEEVVVVLAIDNKSNNKVRGVKVKLEQKFCSVEGIEGEKRKTNEGKMMEAKRATSDSVGDPAVFWKKEVLREEWEVGKIGFEVDAFGSSSQTFKFRLPSRNYKTMEEKSTKDLQPSVSGKLFCLQHFLQFQVDVKMSTDPVLSVPIKVYDPLLK